MNSQFYTSLRPDHDTHGSEVATVGVVHSGATAQHNVQSIFDAQILRHVDFSVAEATTAFPLNSAIKRVHVHDAINWFAIQPTVKNCDLHVNLGNMDFYLLNGVYYPAARWVARAGMGTAMYRIPTQRNYQFAVCPFATTLTAGYADLAVLSFGYLPDERERFYEGV